MSMSGMTAIAGIGQTEFSKESGRSELQLACEAVKDEGWGLLTRITLPSGAKLGVYQPRHSRPSSVRA